MESSLLAYVAAAALAPSNPLHPLIQAYSLACSYGPWVIFAAIAGRLLLPFWKGGR
jgi:hypothetical protein